MADGPSKDGVVRRGAIPPHTQLFNILNEAEQAELLAWAIDNERSFQPAEVYLRTTQDDVLDPERRTAWKLRDLGPNEKVLRERLMDRLPEIMAGTGYRGPTPSSLEFELNAYGEGGHFRPHLDLSTGKDRKPIGAKPGEDRVISAVYYFYTEPKGFSGGALRLFRLITGSDGTEDSVAYEPMQNSLVAFPSWTWHGVERVSCPSGRFSDHRFGLNCWFCRKIGS